MFSANRVIAIDDEQQYLDQLCRALHEAGIPCVPLKYPEQQPPEDGGWFRNVRIMFCDLHLLPSAMNQEQSYGAIGVMLDRIIPAGGSPLLLILWTNYPDEAKPLQDYLAQRFSADKQPTVILSLPKTSFVGENASQLPAEIRKRLDSNPQLRALLEWEDDVSVAADNCVRSLFRLASGADGELGAALDGLLSQLACAASGRKLASENPGASIHEALLPLLSDSLLHLPDDTARIERWKQAMPSAVAQAKITSPDGRAAAVNTALNIVHASSSFTITARERGAVMEITDMDLFKREFSSTDDKVIENFALVKKPENFRWVAVQVEAMCDYAQQKSPCLPFILAVEIPASEKIKDKGKGRPDSIWESPSFLSEQQEVKLVANVRYVMMMSSETAKSRDSVYRLRDSLVNELSFAKARHETRPGFIALY